MSALVDAWRIAETSYSREILCNFYALRKARSAIGVLVEALRDKDEGVRAAAAHALGSLRVLEAGPPLLDALRTEKAMTPKRWMTSALGACGFAGAANDLIAMLDEKDSLLKTQAIWALGELRVDGARERLVGIDQTALDPWDLKIVKDALEKLQIDR